MEETNQTRYFIVFWQANNQVGNSAITSFSFPNRLKFKQKIHDYFYERNAWDMNLEEIAVTNIIELSEEDFKSWIGE